MPHRCFLGRAIVSRHLSPPLERWLDSAWTLNHAGAESSFEIDVSGGSATEPRPTDLYWQERPGLAVGGGANRWWFRCEAGGGSVELDGGHARVVIDERGGSGDDPPRTLLEGATVLLVSALTNSGLIPLHACGVVHRRRALVLAGPSGVGKSTTLLRLLRLGCTPIMEDRGWIDPPSAIVHGWDRAVRVRPEAPAGLALSDLAELAPASIRSDADGKLAVPYECLGAPGLRAAALGRLVLLRRDPTREPGWEAAEPADAVRGLWESVGVPLGTSAREVTADWIASRTRAGLHWFNLSGSDPGQLLGGPEASRRVPQRGHSRFTR